MYSDSSLYKKFVLKELGSGGQLSSQYLYPLYEKFKKFSGMEPEIDSYKRRIREQIASINGKITVFQDGLDENEDLIEQQFQMDMAINSDRISKLKETRAIEAHLQDDLPVLIACLSDMHIEATTTDLERMDLDLSTIASTEGCYWINGGDTLDNAIKHPGMQNNSHPPTKGMRYIDRFLKIAGEKLLAMIGGNHDQWTKAQSGLDYLDTYAKTKGIPYRNNFAHLDVILNGISYKFDIVHKYRFNSSENPNNSVKKYWQHGGRDWDIAIIGHTHELGYEPFFRHNSWKWAIRPGSYQITSSHSEGSGYNDTQPFTPAVILWPNKKKINVFLDLHDGIEYLNLLRSSK